MKSLFYAAFVFLALLVVYGTAPGQVRHVHHKRHTHRIHIQKRVKRIRVRPPVQRITIQRVHKVRVIRAPALVAATKDVHQAHTALKLALPVYGGHRDLAIALCSRAEKDIKAALKWRTTMPPVDFSLRKPVKAHKNRDRALVEYSPTQIQASNSELQSAVSTIQAALQALDQAASDFGGYRTQAANSLNQALQEIQTCLQLRGIP